MTDTAKKRLEICNTCPLFKKVWDGKHRCDGSKYLNPTTMKVSYLPKAGFIKGCSCILEVKVNNPNAKCVAGLW